MRLAGQAQLGYFPTPESQLPLIASWLNLEKEDATLVRALDPCAGEGYALAYLADQLGRRITTYGIELSPQRAGEATKKLNHGLNSGFENTVLTDETFSLVFLNPPYDGSTMTGGGERMEYTFLTASTKCW
jgi:tRNA1(Val) A37 N6-methylase TrmN6